jgi:hypothetical protein
VPREERSAPPVKSFQDVVASELAYIRERRRSIEGRGVATEPGTPPSSVGEDLIGLAMSGGGIRSAIFNLGVLQAFHRAGVFQHVDYVSSVSGGGYIATCLSVLMRAPGSLFPFAPDSRILQGLRDRSQYIGPGVPWLRAGSILLLGLLVNLLTLAPLILFAAFIIAIYGRFRLTDLLPPLSPPVIDPLYLLGLLLIFLAIRSLLEGATRALMWPMLLQMESVAKTAPPLTPKDHRRFKLRARVFHGFALVFGHIPGMGSVGQAAAEFRDVFDAWLDGDWGVVRKKSLEAREIYRRILERVVLAVGVFAVLELQPLVLRIVHSPPAGLGGRFSIELWTAIISLAGALASAGSVAGAPVWGKTLDRVAPYVGGVLGPLGLYLLSVLIAERLLFDLPRELWTSDGLAALFDPAGWDRERVEWVGGVAMLLAGSYFVLPWLLFDLNDRSVHGLYRDSLSKTFVIGETLEGGVAPEGDLRLSELNQTGSSAPYHLYNATLNLQADRSLENTGRNGDFFLFTREVFGSERTGYASTSALEAIYGGFTAASAMATSGAAASPHMGIYSRRSLVPVMSLLNIRLGCWLPNPGNPRRPLSGKTALWRPNPFWLFREMLGRLDAEGRGIYLSDGGHMENTGVYQLLKRRCRVIFAMDATTDPAMRFESLADLKRYARVDLGVEIDIDVGLVRPNAVGLSAAHGAIGTIRYPATATQAASEGRLVLIKSSLTGDEDVEIQAYKAQAPSYPHEPLTDQFFDERQFEAYDLLGFHAAVELLRTLPSQGGPSPRPRKEELERWLSKSATTTSTSA